MLRIPSVYGHSEGWRVFGHSSPALHHSSPGLKIDRKMCILLYALMCRSIWVKSEEYFRVCFHIIFIGQDYDMTTHLPDFCEPSLRMIWSSCIFLRCLRMALLLMFRVLAISREVIFPLLAIRCKMAFLVSGPPLFSFLSSSSFCKDTTNILISQEKMGDNIKKMANLFVISDFCRSKAALGNLKASFHCARLYLLCIWMDSP